MDLVNLLASAIGDAIKLGAQAPESANIYTGGPANDQSVKASKTVVRPAGVAGSRSFVSR